MVLPKVAGIELLEQVVLLVLSFSDSVCFHQKKKLQFYKRKKNNGVLPAAAVGLTGSGLMALGACCFDGRR